jgi:dinuclear metal center YbgI/SA1388 family protein
MQIKEIIGYLETIAPLQYQESYDNAGLLTGNANWEVNNALLTLDVTEEIVQEAIQKNCNLIISHHPIIFRGIKKITGTNYVERVIIMAIKNNIAIYAAHTNLDNIRNGVSNQIADQLGLVNRNVLSPLEGKLCKLYTFVPHKNLPEVRDALFAAGAGHIGLYSECSFNAAGTGTFKASEGSHPFVGDIGKLHEEPETKIEIIFPVHLQSTVIKALLQHHPYEEPAFDIVGLENANPQLGAGIVGELKQPMDEKTFLQFLKDKMQTVCVRHTRLLHQPVRKVAVCGGAGSFLLPKAIHRGAQVFVTADYKYHDFFDADNQIIIADIGHYESELFTVELFYNLLTEKFPNFAPLVSNINTNPVNYLM